MLNADNQNVYYWEWKGKLSNNNYRLEFYNAGNAFTDINYIKIPDCITKFGKLESEFDKITKGLQSDITFDLEFDLNVLKFYGNTYDEFELLIKNDYNFDVDLTTWSQSIFTRTHNISGIVCRLYINSDLFYIGVCEDDFTLTSDIMENVAKLQFSHLNKFIAEKMRFKAGDEDGESDYSRSILAVNAKCIDYNSDGEPDNEYLKWNYGRFIAYTREIDNTVVKYVKGSNGCKYFYMPLNQTIFYLIEYMTLMGKYFYRYNDGTYGGAKFELPNDLYNERYYAQGIQDEPIIALPYSSLYVLWSVWDEKNTYRIGSTSVRTKSGFIIKVAEKYETLWDFLQDFIISEDMKYIITTTNIQKVADWQEKDTVSSINLYDFFGNAKKVIKTKDLKKGDSRITEFVGSSEFTSENEINNKKYTVKSRNKQDYTIPILLNNGYADVTESTDSNSWVKQTINDTYNVDKVFYFSGESQAWQVNDQFRNPDFNVYDYLEDNFDIGALVMDSQGKNCKISAIAKNYLKYYSKAWTLDVEGVIPYGLQDNYIGNWYNFDLSLLGKNGLAISKPKKWECLKSTIDLDADTIELTLLTSEYEGA